MKKFRLLLGVVAMFCALAVNAQTQKFEATVVDELGEPCIGASVVVKGTTTGVMTNIDGSFSIDVPKGGEVEVSYIGYVTQTISNFSITQIVLEEDRQQIEEVVVVGYGVQKKSHLTGSIATVPMDDIQDLSSGDVASTLKGLMPGVSISGGDTRPGENATISIRGNNSVSDLGGSSNGATPLYVIDGYIYPNDVKAGDTTGINLGAEAFNNLDPSSIESISVLKDASAAVYGSRAANGVILVTTKKGKQGAPQVSYSGTVGIADSWSHPSMLSAADYGRLYNAITYAGMEELSTGRNHRTDIFQKDELDAMESLNYNLLEKYWRTAITHKHSVNLTGATEKTNYYGGVSYFNQDGNLGKLDYGRWTFRAGVEAKIGNNLKVGVNVNGDYGNKTKPYIKIGGSNDENDYRLLLTHPRYIPEYVNGRALLTYGPKNTSGSDYQLYHFDALQTGGDYQETMSSTLNIGANVEYDWGWIKPLKGLTMKFTYSKSISTDKTNEFGSEYDAYYMNKRAGSGNHLYTPTSSPIYEYDGDYETLINDAKNWRQNGDAAISNGDEGGSVRRTMTRTDNYQINFNVAYARDFGKNSISALFSVERSEAETEWLMGVATYPYAFGTHQSNSIASKGKTDGRFTRYESATLSYVGRINYAYDDKYLVEVLLRSDASTKFAPENYWGLFPSVSAGWVISKEQFMQDINWLDFLKLRASFGLTGRDNVTPWQWQQTYGTDADKGAIFGTSASDKTGSRITMSSQNASVNRDAHWDKSYKMNIGVDWNVLSNRLGFNIDYWQQWDREMLIAFGGSNLPGTIGTKSAAQNWGEMDSWGVEFSASWRDKINKDWSYRVQLNTGYSDNKVRLMEWPTGADAYSKQQINGRTDVGLWGLECIGMFRKPGDVRDFCETYLWDQESYDTKGNKVYGTYLGLNGDPALNQIRPGMLKYKDVGSRDADNRHVKASDYKVDAEDDMVRMSKFKSNPYGVTANLGFEWKSLSFSAQMSASWGGYGTYSTSMTKISSGELEYMSMPSFWTTDKMFVVEDIRDEEGNVTVKGNRDTAIYPNLAYDINSVTSTFWKYSLAQVSLSRVTIAYNLPKKWMTAIGIQSCRINVTGQNLVNFINPYPDKFMSATTGNNSYYSYPRLRKITLGLNITF